MFTIIITTHNRPHLLTRALHSLAKQTFQKFTAIIISDSSQYIPPYEALNALPGQYIYLLRNGTPGPAASRNLGINLANSEYALFLDDDDTLDSEHLQRLADRLINTPLRSDEILYCDFKVLEEDRSNLPPEFLKESPVSIPGITREQIFVSNLIPNSCLVFPLATLQSARFDPALILFEDWDYLLACLKNSHLCHLPINTVNIHKSHIEGSANLRRGNVNHEHLLGTTLEIYRRHPSPDEATRVQRNARFAAIGIDLPADFQ